MTNNIEASVETIKTSNPTTCIGLHHTRVDLPNGDSVMYDNRMPDCGGLINCAPKILRVAPTLLPSTPTKEEMMTWTVEQFNEFSKQHKLRPLVETEAEWWNGNGPFHDFREQMIEQYLGCIETFQHHEDSDDDLPEPEEPYHPLSACHLDLKKFYCDNFEWEETIDDHLDRRYDAVNGEPIGSVEPFTSTPSTNWKSHLNSRTGMFEFGAITTNISGYTKRHDEALKARHQATKMISYTIPKCESYNLDFDDDPQSTHPTDVLRSVPLDGENVSEPLDGENVTVKE